MNKPKSIGRYPTQSIGAEMTLETAKTILASIATMAIGDATSGVLLGEAFKVWFNLPLSISREKWAERLTEVIEYLLQNAITLEELENNHAFTAAVMQATNIAARNHRIEKLNQLKNGVIAVGMGNYSDTQMLFWPLLDRYTPEHIRMLELNANSNSWSWEQNQAGNGNQTYSAKPKVELTKVIGNTSINDELEMKYLKDLINDGLIKEYTMLSGGMNSDPNTQFAELMCYTNTKDGMVKYGEPVATNLGIELLDFIKEPK